MADVGKQKWLVFYVGLVCFAQVLIKHVWWNLWNLSLPNHHILADELRGCPVGVVYIVSDYHLAQAWAFFKRGTERQLGQWICQYMMFWNIFIENSGWWVAFHSACCGDFCLLSAILRLSTGWRLSWDWLWISRYVRIRTVWVISLVLKTNYHLPNGGPIVIHSEDPITLPGRAHSSNRRGCMGRSGPTWNQE